MANLASDSTLVNAGKRPGKEANAIRPSGLPPSPERAPHEDLAPAYLLRPTPTGRPLASSSPSQRPPSGPKQGVPSPPPTSLPRQAVWGALLPATPKPAHAAGWKAGRRQAGGAPPSPVSPRARALPLRVGTVKGVLPPREAAPRRLRTSAQGGWRATARCVPVPRARGGWGGWDGWAGPAARRSGLGAVRRGAARPGSRAAWAPSADRRRPPPPTRLGDARWGCGLTTSLARQGRGQGAVPP